MIGWIFEYSFELTLITVAYFIINAGCNCLNSEDKILNSLKDGPVNDLNGLFVVFDLERTPILLRPSDFGILDFILTADEDAFDA